MFLYLKNRELGATPVLPNGGHELLCRLTGDADDLYDAMREDWRNASSKKASKEVIARAKKAMDDQGDRRRALKKLIAPGVHTVGVVAKDMSDEDQRLFIYKFGFTITLKNGDWVILAKTEECSPGFAASRHIPWRESMPKRMQAYAFRIKKALDRDDIIELVQSFLACGARKDGVFTHMI